MNDAIRMRRNTDPGTSHAAATRHAATNLSERRSQVLELVVANEGRTQGELARLMFSAYHLPINICASTPHKRLPELECLGLVCRGGKRSCGDSGYQSATWWAL